MKTPSKKQLEKFLAKHRIQDEKTWSECAEIAFIELDVASTNNEPYSGSGFQLFCERITGQKKWGTRQMRGKPRKNNNDDLADCNAAIDDTPENHLVLETKKEKTLMDYLEEIIASDLPKDTKEIVTKSLFAYLD